jgi:predicted esterase
VKTSAEITSTAGTPAAFVILRLLALLWAVMVGMPAGLVLVAADTWLGRSFGMTAALVALWPMVIVIAGERRTRRWGTISLGCVALGFATAFPVVYFAPGGTPQGGHVTSQRSPANARLSRYGLSNLLPEEDQLLAGFTLIPFVDPLLSMQQARELRDLTRQLYRELESDPDFRELGSAMGYTYETMFAGPLAEGHCYTYVPSAVGRGQPAPLLIFFHGSGGNFKAYLWILSKLAARSGFVLVAPTGGTGDWSTAESEDGLALALDTASRVATIDRHRVHLAGLSNGGRAVSQLTARHGSDFASTIFISPVFDSAAVASRAFEEQCRDRRVFVTTGGQDNRVPLSYVEENVAAIRRAGGLVKLRSFDEADHFLIFSHREALITDLQDWLSR